MAFPRDEAGFYRPPGFGDILWLFGGFGTRTSPPPEGELVTLHQVHSAEVIRVEKPGPAGTGDALISNTPGLLLAVKTADCVPLLMADFHHRAVAAVHAGWRGAAQGIAAKAVAAMKEAFGTRPEDLHVAIGPGIGRCCFEVGGDVAEEFAMYGKRQSGVQGAGGKMLLDLPGVNRDQLETVGVPRDQIEDAESCTYCSPNEFFSFRREREKAGRMFSVIGIRK